LISSKNGADEEHQLQLQLDSSWQGKLYSSRMATLFLLTGFLFGGATLLPLRAANSKFRYGAGLFASLSLAVSVAITAAPPKPKPSPSRPPKTPAPRRSGSGRLAVDEFEQSDLVWNILKSFSILTVRDGKGNMHRLLAQSLRMAHSDEECCQNLRICVEAMNTVWHFQPKRAETWQDSLYVVEHVKSLVSHVAERDQDVCGTAYKAGVLSKEAGIFAAMALNAFLEAQASLELALKIFDMVACAKESERSIMQARADALHELGRVFRYQGSFEESEKSLLAALCIRNKLAKADASAKLLVADTLHELGVLEVKKHSLDTAETYLNKALNQRRTVDDQDGEIEAECAATLHQLAAVHVARKPPLLCKAEELLQEALKLSRQIGQRAATLKQLARVTIRQGLLDTAELYLRRALELYVELYGERAMHINVAAVKFQQGALSHQREQLEDAWIHFSECLRIRRHVYAYAKPVETPEENCKDPIHIEVSCCLHELGCVAYAQGRHAQSLAMLQAERSILEKLEESSSTQAERLHQARLTNLTWLRKCAKEIGDENAVAQYTNERAQLKSKGKAHTRDEASREHAATHALQREAIRCRLIVRQFALEKAGDKSQDRATVLDTLSVLAKEIDRSPSGSMKHAASEFHDHIAGCLRNHTEGVPRSSILKACDTLR